MIPTLQDFTSSRETEREREKQSTQYINSGGWWKVVSGMQSKKYNRKWGGAVHVYEEGYNFKYCNMVSVGPKQKVTFEQRHEGRKESDL